MQGGYKRIYWERTVFMQELKWDNLLTTKRERESENQNKDTNPLIARSQLEADYDRIVGASSVRRLQDKAQVFPLQKDDVARTRLTHSMEVSALARSLGKAVGNQLILRGKWENDLKGRNRIDDLAALLQTTGLIHDLGNPPFGHYGERAISEWFEKWFEKNDTEKFPALKELSVREKADFEFFDGNVQNLRIVTKLQTQNDEFGANFTYATLACLMKYPVDSKYVLNLARNQKSKKKFGYFKSEEDIVFRVQQATGLCDGIRHPATYLLEAADDIIYLCDDIEDGVKKGLINWELVYPEFKSEVFEKTNYDKDIRKLFAYIDGKQPDPLMEKKDIQIANSRNFRNAVQTYLFKKAEKSFLNHYDEIMQGKKAYTWELLDDERCLTDSLGEITKKYCLASNSVLSLEVIGHNVINSLLDIFVGNLCSKDAKSTISGYKEYDAKLYHMISSNYKYILRKECRDMRDDVLIKDIPLYNKLHLIVDYISGMTDSYAVNIYQQLLGVKYP